MEFNRYKTASMFSDESEKRRKRRNIGISLLALGLGGNVAMAGRQLLKGRKAAKILKGSPFASTEAVDEYIRKHLAKTGKKLPKYKWSDLKDIKGSGKVGLGSYLSDKEVAELNERFSRGHLFGQAPEPLTSEKTIPVYGDIEDVLKGFDMGSAKDNGFLSRIMLKIRKHILRKAGPHFSQDAGYITIGNRGFLNPKVLMHELGHAQDAIEGKLHASSRSLSSKSLKDWWNGLVNPDSTSLLQDEIRAWDNAGIKAGDKMREAALDTYRSAVQANRMSPVFGTLQIPGAYMYIKNRDKKGGKRK